MRGQADAQQLSGGAVSMTSAAAALYDGLLPRAMPQFTLPQLSPGERALVVGMGGGCDVFAATALARKWKAQHQSSPETTVLFANCIAPSPAKKT